MRLRRRIIMPNEALRVPKGSPSGRRIGEAQHAAPDPDEPAIPIGRRAWPPHRDLPVARVRWAQTGGGALRAFRTLSTRASAIVDCLKDCEGLRPSERALIIKVNDTSSALLSPRSLSPKSYRGHLQPREGQQPLLDTVNAYFCPFTWQASKQRSPGEGKSDLPSTRQTRARKRQRKSANAAEQG